MRYAIYNNGEFVKNPDGTVCQYDEVELKIVISDLIEHNEIEQLTIYSSGRRPDAKV
jgi:hypothetical protein